MEGNFSLIIFTTGYNEFKYNNLDFIISNEVSECMRMHKIDFI